MYVVKSVKWTGKNIRAVVELLSGHGQSSIFKSGMVKLVGKSDWSKPGCFICVYSDGSCGVEQEV